MKVAPALTCTVNTRMSRLLWLHIQRVYKKKCNYQVVDQCVCSSSDLRNQPYRRADGGRRSAKWKPGQQLHVSSDISLWRKLHRTVDALKTIRRRTRLPPSCMLRATEGEAAWSREEKFESQTQTEWCKKKLFKKPDDCRKTFCDWSNQRLESEFWCWWHWTSSELVETMRLAKEPLGWCELH